MSSSSWNTWIRDSEVPDSATALTLAREGVRVAICARNRAPLLATSHRIAEETGAEVVASPAASYITGVSLPVDGGHYKGTM